MKCKNCAGSYFKLKNIERRNDVIFRITFVCDDCGWEFSLDTSIEISFA